MIKKQNFLHKKIFLGVVVALLFGLLGAFLVLVAGECARGESLLVGDEEVFVEIVRTEADRARGLSGRHDLCNTCGMLFVFDTPGFYSFWMKDMYFDIDIIWISHGKIVHLSENVNHKGGVNEVINTPCRVTDVLEVPAGYISSNSVMIGQSVRYRRGVFE